MTEPRERLAVRSEIDRKTNFASQQNDFPVVKSFHIDNQTTESFLDVEVRISGEPEFCQLWSTRIASIPPDGTYTLQAVDLQLSATTWPARSQCYPKCQIPINRVRLIGQEEQDLYDSHNRA